MKGSPAQVYFFTVPELARRAGVSARRIRELINAGELRAYLLTPSRPRVAWADFVQWTRSVRVTPTPGARAHGLLVVERRLAREAAAKP